jgi:site-specific DNA recombinase
MPYEYTPHLNSAALFGMKLFSENRREAGEIGTFAYYDNVKSVSS